MKSNHAITFFALGLIWIICCCNTECDPADGPCCHDGDILPSTVQCASWTEYRCSTEICGAKAQQRNSRQYCNGKNSECSGEFIRDEWLDIKQCDAFWEACETDEKSFARCNACEQHEACKYDGKCGIVAKLTASDAQEDDSFGTVSISGNFAIVGASGEDGGFGNPKPGAGAAYIFKRIGDTWNQVAKLTASDAQTGDGFGVSVSISSDFAIVGAYGEDGGDGDPELWAGAAYFFSRTGDSWEQVAKLMASDAQENDNFGRAVSISGDFAIVGAYLESGGDGNPKSHAGAAYIFQQTGDAWNQVVKIMASDAKANDHYGFSVSINGDLAIVGAQYADAACIFERAGDTWNQIAKLTVVDVHEWDAFGKSVSISNDYAIVGASFDDGEDEHPMEEAGAAYIFKRTGDSWNQVAKIMASDAREGHYLGVMVSINDDFAIVGSSSSGGAYVFKRTGDAWNQVVKFISFNAQGTGGFGSKVFVNSDNSFIVGARGENGQAGAAYIY